MAAQTKNAQEAWSTEITVEDLLADSPWDNQPEEWVRDVTLEELLADSPLDDTLECELSEPPMGRNDPPHPAARLILHPREVAAMLGVSESSLHELLQRDPTFPRPVQVLPREPTIGFIGYEVEDWVMARPRFGAASHV